MKDLKDSRLSYEGFFEDKLEDLISASEEEAHKWDERDHVRARSLGMDHGSRGSDDEGA